MLDKLNGFGKGSVGCRTIATWSGEEEEEEESFPLVPRSGWIGWRSLTTSSTLLIYGVPEVIWRWSLWFPRSRLRKCQRIRKATLVNDMRTAGPGQIHSSRARKNWENIPGKCQFWNSGFSLPHGVLWPLLPGEVRPCLGSEMAF